MVLVSWVSHAQILGQTVGHGPRMGLVWLFQTDGGDDLLYVDDLEGDRVSLSGISTIFGYHVDYLIEADAELKPIVQVNFLALGIERMLIIPSVFSGFGVRHSNGFETGAGPGLFGRGTGIVFALGYNFQMGNVMYPVNLAYGVSGNVGKLSLTTGFNIPKR